MSPPDPLPLTPGVPITIAVAGLETVEPAVVRPLCGADEIRLAELLMAEPSMPPVCLEQALLDQAVATIGGVQPDFMQLGALRLGDRNRLVLAALCATYGAPAELLLPCGGPGCGLQNELAFDPWRILDAAPDGADATATLEVGGHRFDLRLPCGADLLALAERGSDAADDLLSLCAPGAPPTPAAEAAITEEIEARDPCAEIVFRSNCPNCGASMSNVLDPLVLFNDAMCCGGGILSELDLIARTYHWSEADLLSLSANRRRAYLSAIRNAEPAGPERQAS